MGEGSGEIRPAAAGESLRLGPGAIVRAILGGVLMGLANLVPGISGGTMLLAVGIYPAFIAAVADVTLLRLRLRSLVVLGCVAMSAALAILLLAGTVKSLVIEQRWIMYSLFIGLTLGGVPLVWRLARPATSRVWQGGGVGLTIMLLMALGAGGGGGDGGNPLLLFFSGLAGASAMILPGISGGYLLLLLGQYESILGAVDQVKSALLGQGGPDVGMLLETLPVVLPVGLGVVAGAVGVSNLLRWALRRYEKTTLGILLGLLVGAVVGLYPFQQGVEPQPGERFKGQVLTQASIADLDPEDWPLEPFQPSGGQIAAAIGLIAAGFAATRLIDAVGRRAETNPHDASS